MTLLTLRVSAQATLHTILSNAPTAASYNLVVLSEGYTAAQLPQFRSDATNAVNAILSREPYREYRSVFNAFAISVASSEPGSDHPAYGVTRKTYFNSSYDKNSDYLITIPSDSTGQGKVDALLQTFVPDCNLSVLLVNDLVAGGSDGGANTAITSIAGIPDILVHEIGHVVAGLGDEYTLPNPGFPDIEEPNTTRETNRDRIKWKAWIAPDTPAPTPPFSQYQNAIGLFEGAHYHTTGWYRPKLNCTMQSPWTSEFCEVCREATVLAFYAKIRPIQAFSPTSKTLYVNSPNSLNFNIICPQPLTHSLSIQWSTNGTPVPGAIHPTLTLPPQHLLPGANSVGVTVKDDTAFVRTDPAALLSEAIAWTVIVNLPQLHLDAPVMLHLGNYALRVSGNAPQGFVIQGASNLQNWISLSTNFLSAGQFWYTNSSERSSLQFFRAKTPP